MSVFVPLPWDIIHVHVIFVIIFVPWHFFSTVLKLANVELHVWNGYNGDSETVNMLARHTTLKL